MSDKGGSSEIVVMCGSSKATSLFCEQVITVRQRAGPWHEERHDQTLQGPQQLREECREKVPWDGATWLSSQLTCLNMAADQTWEAMDAAWAAGVPRTHSSLGRSEEGT